MMPTVPTTDGRSSDRIENYDLPLPVVVAAMRVCLANDARDVLEILGVTR